MEDGDPLARLDETEAQAADEGWVFDREAELQQIEAMGYTFPLPIVARVLALAELVRAAGWRAARRLSREVFRGWEVDFLAVALPIVARFQRAEALVEQARLFGLTRRA